MDVSHTGKAYSRHPCDQSVKVYFLFDHIHCYKNLASHIRDKIVKLPDGQLFSIADFQEAIDKRGFFEISEGQHLKQKQLDATGQERQRVKHAVHMLSNATADLIQKQNPDDPRKLAIVKCLRALHNGHLVLTSNRWEPNENKLHSPFGEFCTILYLLVPFCTSLYPSVAYCTLLCLFVPFCNFFVTFCIFLYHLYLLYLLYLLFLLFLSYLLYF